MLGKIKFLFLLVLLPVFSCDAQYATPAATRYVNRNKVTTNTDNEQVILVISDSTPVTNNTTGAGPTPTTGALQEWDGSAFVAVTSEVSNANNGSMFPQFANDYYAEFGYKTLLVNKSAPGSEYSPNGDNNNWSPSGTLYADAITECDQALADQGLEAPVAIFLSLGINDARGAVSLSTVRADMDLLWANLSAHYPTTPILVIQIGSSSSATPVDSRISDLRRHTYRLVDAYANASFVVAPSMRGAGLYGADFLHYNQTGLNTIGTMFNRWFKAHRDGYSKWAASIIASHHDDLSTTRKDLIEDFVATETYQNADMFLNFHTTTKNNTFVDWKFLAQPLDFGFTFSANDAITTNPTGSLAYVSGYIPSFMALNVGQNDYVQGVKVKTNSTAAGTQGSIMTATSTAQSLLEQTTTPSILYRLNDGTLNQYTGHTSFQNDSFYAVGRNGTSKYLYQNGTQLATATVSSTGFTSDALGIGCRHASGAVSVIINASFEYAVVHKYTISSLSQSYTDLETLRDNW